MNEIDEIIAKYLIQQADEQELVKLKNWLEESEENTVYFQHTCAIWNQAGENNIQFDSDKAFSKFKENTHLTNKQATNTQKHKFSPILKWAAIFILLIGAASVLYLNINRGTQLITVENNKKQPKLIILPDSSSIWLKKGQLSYSSTIGKDNKRLVTLKGEAFFHVQHIKNSSFTVNAGCAFVEVVGTQFNVSTSDSLTLIYVKEGKVKFSSFKSPNNIITVTSNQQAKVIENGKCFLLDKVTNSTNSIAWKTRQLFFKNESLPNVLKEIEENTSKKFIIKNKEIKDELFTGNVNIDSTEYYCNLLHNLYNINVVSKGDSIILY